MEGAHSQSQDDNDNNCPNPRDKRQSFMRRRSLSISAAAASALNFASTSSLSVASSISTGLKRSRSRTRSISRSKSTTRTRNSSASGGRESTSTSVSDHELLNTQALAPPVPPIPFSRSTVSLSADRSSPISTTLHTPASEKFRIEKPLPPQPGSIQRHNSMRVRKPVPKLNLVVLTEQEEGRIECWKKCCPSLKKVCLLSGKEWIYDLERKTVKGAGGVRKS